MWLQQADWMKSPEYLPEQQFEHYPAGHAARRAGQPWSIHWKTRAVLQPELPRLQFPSRSSRATAIGYASAGFQSDDSSAESSYTSPGPYTFRLLSHQRSLPFHARSNKKMQRRIAQRASLHIRMDYSAG